jgi:hypothetical protein
LQVNEAVNELLIDEEDFEGLRSSITTHDNFDQVRERHSRSCMLGLYSEAQQQLVASQCLPYLFLRQKKLLHVLLSDAHN